jgi:hypothetical protein
MLYNLYINVALHLTGVNVALFAADPCVLRARTQGYVLRKLQHDTNTIEACCTLEHKSQ